MQVWMLLALVMIPFIKDVIIADIKLPVVLNRDSNDR